MNPYVVVLIPAAVSFLLWLALLLLAKDEDWINAASAQIALNMEKNEKSKRRYREGSLRHAHTGIEGVFWGLIYDDPAKKIARREARNEEMRQGNLRHLPIYTIPGYVLQREIPRLTKGPLFSKFVSQCTELHGKKYGILWARRLMAQILSAAILGFFFCPVFGIAITAKSQKIGLIASVLVVIVYPVIVYALYDQSKDMVMRRRQDIVRSFPNVVSKLALLVTSGMIMDRAWRETAESGDSVLYQEMQQTAEELENLVRPEVAYADFINRCNTRETTKLATVILQNLTRGNAEIGSMLKGMAEEAWLERKNGVKQDAERANSKMMIPTMLLLFIVGIMVLMPTLMMLEKTNQLR